MAALGLVAVLAVAGCGSNGGGSGGFTADSGPADVSTVKPDAGPTDGGMMSEAASSVCPTPTFDPPSGTSDPGNVTISATGLPASGIIYYTTDGTNPSPSSSVYSNPIQISADTTIRAASLASGVCSLSPVAQAMYTVTPLEGGALGTVVFNPLSETEPNDFPVVLSASPSSATICYTLDGTMPACSAGACSGNSKTYDAANPISINGSVTNQATGQVTVTAIACEAGAASSTSQSQTYTLQAAAPTMVTPAPAVNIPWVPGGFTPTISSPTVASLTPADTPAIFVTVDGAAPSCAAGISIGNPSTFGSAGLTAPFNANVTGNHVYQALTCKTGYLPSAVQTFTYSFQLANPGVSGTGTYNDAPSVGLTTTTPPAVPGITDPNDTAASGGWDYLCYDLAGAATCGTAGACGTGSTKLAAAVTVGSKTSAAATLSVVACNSSSGQPGGINNSAGAGSATYTLQYAPPWLYSGAAPAQVGWDYLGTAATPGQPNTSLDIPASAGANPWVGTFSAYQVADLGGEAQPNNTVLPQAGYPTTKPWSTAVAAFPSYTVPDYMCWQYCAKGATCAALTCGGGGACVTAAGKSGQITFADAPGGTNALPATLAVSVGDAVSLIACENPPANPATEIVYNPSAVTTVTFAAAGAASPPTVSAATVTPYTVQAAPTVSNNDASQSTICWTYSAAAVTPTCTNSVCNVPAVTVTGNDSAKGSLVLAPKGAPQGFTITNLTKTGNNMTITVGTTAGFANGMPIVIAGNSVAANNGIFTLNAAPGATTLQYANAAGVAGTTGGTVGGYTTATFNTATSAAYGTSPVASAPPLGLIQRDGYVLSAIACNSVESSSSVASQVYHFSVAQPDFTSNAGYLAGNYGDLDLATTIGAGARVWLTAPSNFDSTLVAPEKVEAIDYATGASVACGSATAVNLQKVIASGTATGLADVWDNGTTPPTTQIGPSGNVLLTAPTTGTSWTVSAIGCGESLTAQLPSTPRTATFDLTAAAPTVLTNQDPNAGSCGASPLPACCAASNTCAPAAEWERTFNVTLTSTTPGTSICYSTSQAPTCTSSTGKCSGAGVLQVASGTAAATVSIANSPTTLYVQGCAANLDVPAAQTYSFDIFTTPPTLVLPAGGVCNTATGPTVELATTVANPVDKTDLAQGGPTPGSCVCYTTDTSAAQCVNATSGGCDYAPAGTATGNGFGGPPGTTVQCFNGGGTKQVTVTTTTTINMSTCAFGIDTTTATQVYSTSSYAHTIKVDGLITDWTQTAEAANLYYDVEDNHTFCSNLGGVGLFTYDAANLYVGASIGGSMSGACCNYSGGCQHGACVGNAGTWIVGYIGENGAVGASVELGMFDPNRIITGSRAIDPAIGIQYAFAYDTSGTPPTVGTYQWANGAWSVSAFPVSVSANLATNFFEFGVPFSGIGVTAASTVTFFGAAIADVGTAQTVGDGSNELFRFPATNYLNCEANGGPCAAFTYASYYEDNLASCLNPNNNVKNVSGANSGGLTCFAGP
jgi:hypothetical protein